MVAGWSGAEGKGGHSRLVPISGRFFSSVSRYLEEERPSELEGDRLFVVLKGPNRGRPLTPKGLEQIMRGARERAGMTHATCHELRHTCLTRLREAGTSMEAGPATTGRPLQRNPPTAPVAGMSCRVT